MTPVKTQEEYESLLVSSGPMDRAIERYNKAKENGTLDEEFPVIVKLMNKQDMRERFEELLEKYYPEPLAGMVRFVPIQDFIESEINLALQEQQEEIINKIEKLKTENSSLEVGGKNQQLDDVISLIKESNTE